MGTLLGARQLLLTQAQSTAHHTDRPGPPGYEQKPDTRPTTPGEWAADRETKPEDGAEVDRELGRGQITFLSGEIQLAYP
jgi:hypothetical protein